MYIQINYIELNDNILICQSNMFISFIISVREIIFISFAFS